MKNTIRLKEKYKSEVIPMLMKDLKIGNIHAVPALTKIVVNMGIGEGLKNKEFVESAKKDMAAITGQAPSVRKAKISVASFGIRKGMAVGLKVTLRGDRMYHFLDKLISVVFPRLRDFRGFSYKYFDGSGNYSLGLREHVVFPEIDLSKTTNKGLEITFVTSAKTKDDAIKLLLGLGFPFEKLESEHK